MSAQVTQAPSIVRQIIFRYRWPIALGILCVVAALAAFHFTNASSSAPTSFTNASWASYADPAQQGVLGYLQAHERVAEASASDPAQQGVLGYLRAHQTGAATSPLDPAQQGVLGYLQAHHK